MVFVSMPKCYGDPSFPVLLEETDIPEIACHWPDYGGRRTRAQPKAGQRAGGHVVEGGSGPGDHDLAVRGDEEIHTTVGYHP
jgi:hypothetical protein